MPHSIAHYFLLTLRYVRNLSCLLLALLSCNHFALAADTEETENQAKIVQTPYSDEQKTVFEFFFNHPAKIGTGLDWLRIYMNTLVNDPYGMAPEFMDVKVVIHGTEIVTLLKKNYEKYSTAVERMKYYATLGVDFIACHSFAEELGYHPRDFYEFVTLAPSGPNEVIHWQQQGHALIIPLAQDKLIDLDELRAQ